MFNKRSNDNKKEILEFFNDYVDIRLVIALEFNTIRRENEFKTWQLFSI